MRLVKYLLANRSDYSWGISTTTVGLQEVPPGGHYPYGEHSMSYMFSTERGRVLSDGIHILYLLKGRGWFVSDHCPKTQIQAGDAVILFPNEWHNYAPDEDSGWEEGWVGFTGDFVQRIIKENFFDISHPIVSVGIRMTLYDAIKNACKIALDERPAHQQQLAGYVFLCVDNIELRKDICEENYYNNYIKGIFDIRMRLTDAQGYCANWQNRKEKDNLLKTMNFTHDEAKETTPLSACGTSLNVTPTVRIIVSLQIANWINFVKEKEYKKVILIDAFSYDITTF